MKASVGKNGRPRRVLIIVENLPVPFDRRVWMEATTLQRAGFEVSVICPKGKDFNKSYEVLEGVHIYRHSLPVDARGAMGYLLEYPAALFWQFVLSWRVLLTRGFDVIHACNPPDLIFLVAGFFKLFLGKKFLFDHHDLCPELFEAKFGKKGFFYGLMRVFETLTFKVADVSIATNGSYKDVAVNRNGMDGAKVFIVRSGPDLNRFKIMAPEPAHKKGRKYMIGYVGVMGQQEGLNFLLDAAEHVVKVLKRQDVQFCLVGGGPELPLLEVDAKRRGIEDFVTFTGRVPDEDLLSVLNTADVCVNTDRHTTMNDKSTMNKVVEYMALGKPIVQFESTEGRVSAGESSLYARPDDPVDLADKIVALLEDPDRRAEMGAVGYQRVKDNLAWQHQIPVLLSAYGAIWGESLGKADLGSNLVTESNASRAGN